MESVELDLDRRKKAREYARLRRRLMLIDLAIGAAYLLAWIFSGWSIDLRDALARLTQNAWLQVAGFSIALGGVYYLINLPLGCYSGFILPHRYNLSTQTLKGWVSDQVKGLLVGGVLGLAVIEVIYFILRTTHGLWWLWTGGMMLIFNIVLANLAPIVLFPIFYKFIPLGEEHTDLAERLIELARRAGARVNGVYKFDMSRRTKAANAALAGLGNTRRILLGDTLLSEFTPDEIETILAHELGHHMHRDIPLSLLVESLIMLGGLYLASLAMDWGLIYFGYFGIADVAAMPLFGLVLGLYGLITMPLGNAYSRWRERLADEYALQATGKGAAYASALTRLANQNLTEVDPEPWVEFLLYSHPALGKRIEMANRSESGYRPAA